MMRRGRRGAWWRFAITPLPLATAVAFVLGMSTLRDLADGLAEAERLRQDVTREQLAIVAESALLRSLTDGLPGPVRVSDSAGVAVVEQTDEGWLVGVDTSADARVWFTAPALPGAAPVCLAVPASVGEADMPGTFAMPPRPLARSDMPRFRPEALATATGPELCRALRRDPAVALQYLAAGTDAPDWVLADGADRVDFTAVGDLLAVSGNLWIEPAAAPLRIVLVRDLVVRVAGNLYLGRGLQVDGGRLLFVIEPGAGQRAFCDGDRDGKFSTGDRLLGDGPFTGPIEGGGSAFVGLRSPVAAGPLAFGAGLVVAGQLHLASDLIIDGPLVLQHGVTVASGRIQATGRRLYRPDRERVSGLAVVGAGRPGLLQCVGSDRPVGQQLPLYVASPVR